MDESAANPLLVILDLDETLIYSSEGPLDREADGRVGRYFVYRRPHVRSFIEALSRDYQVAIWTSATADYAADVIRLIVPEATQLTFVWSSDRCTRKFDAELQEFYWIKDLKKIRKLSFDLDRVLVVDDTPTKHERNYGNLIRVRPYLGEHEDDELPQLLTFIRELAQVKSVRAVEKRGWQRRRLK